MAKTVRPYTTTITVSSGSGSDSITVTDFNAIVRAGGYIEQILISAPAPADEFDFNITDEDDFIVFEKIGSVGKINDTTRIPFRGEATLNILEATNDGSYEVKILFREEW